MNPDTLWSSTANTRSADCMRSNEVAFQTKSTLKLNVKSTGQREFRTSTAISSCERRTTCPTDSHASCIESPGCRSLSSSPGTSRSSVVDWLSEKHATFFLFRPVSQRTLTPVLVCDSFLKEKER